MSYLLERYVTGHAYLAPLAPAEFDMPDLAVAVMGGLTVSTAVSLLVLPSLVRLLQREGRSSA